MHDTSKFGECSNVLVFAKVFFLLTRQIEKLSDIQCQPESQLKFIIEAWLQVISRSSCKVSETSGLGSLI